MEAPRHFLEEELSKTPISRPKPTTDFKSQPLIFMLLDIDYSTTTNEKGEEIPVVRLYGITEQGNSVMILVNNFHPYFYASLPEGAPLLQ